MKRRNFLQALGAVAALGELRLGHPEPAFAEGAPSQPTSLIEQFLCAKPPPLPSDALFARDPEAYWAELRKQFLFRPGFLYLNNGTIGSMPLPVARALVEATLKNCQMESDDTELYPLWGYGPWEEYRKPVAEFIGAEVPELALVRNATEGLNYVANGLDLKPGDELITTDQEHPSGINPWLLKAKRYGIVVKQVTLPTPPAIVQQIVDLFDAQRTARTRAVMFSHITSQTGTVLPAHELCAWARQHGILSEVDGAHATGQIPINVREIGCDFYISSPHKWLLAPPGCGLLYVRGEACERLWNTIATGDWDNREMRAARFQQFGSTNVSILEGLKAAIDFWHAISPKRIERRIRNLHAYLKKFIVEAPGAQVQSAPGEEFTAAMLAVNFPGLDRLKLQNWMYQKHHIRIRGTSPTRLRLSTHIYHSHADLDRFLATLTEYQRGQIA